jgi:hypothetical protein
MMFIRRITGMCGWLDAVAIRENLSRTVAQNRYRKAIEAGWDVFFSG